MPRSSKPRKRYIPKRVDADPFDLASARAALVPPHVRAQFERPMQASFDLLRRGAGNWSAWCNLADSMNVAERLADLGIASDRKADILQAQAALAALHDRHANSQSWTLRGAEIAALQLATEIHEIQLEFATQGELYEAIATVQRCVQQALAGNVSPRATVCVAGALGASHG